MRTLNTALTAAVKLVLHQQLRQSSSHVGSIVWYQRTPVHAATVCRQATPRSPDSASELASPLPEASDLDIAYRQVQRSAQAVQLPQELLVKQVRIKARCKFRMMLTAAGTCMACNAAALCSPGLVA